MAECQWFAECGVVKNKKTYVHEAVRMFFENQYCHDKHSDCACYKVFDVLGKDNVPRDLLPNQLERATEIIDNSH